MHSSGFFRIKLIARLILKRKILGSHTISDQSLLLSTNVLNDMCISFLYVPVSLKGHYNHMPLLHFHIPDHREHAVGNACYPLYYSKRYNFGYSALVLHLCVVASFLEMFCHSVVKC